MMDIIFEICEFLSLQEILHSFPEITETRGLQKFEKCKTKSEQKFTQRLSPGLWPVDSSTLKGREALFQGVKHPSKPYWFHLMISLVTLLEISSDSETLANIESAF